jgi:hypothetical protein
MASLITMKLLMMMMLIVMMLQWSLVYGQQQSGSNEDLEVPPQNIAELPSDANVTTTASVDRIGVRILYDEGKPTMKADESCTAAELALIQSTALNMIYNRRDRHLRRRSLSGANSPPPQRQLWMPGYCYTVCRGFVTGKCQVIYPACAEWRRELGASSYVHDSTDTPVVDQNNSDNGSLDQDGERKLLLPLAANDRCQYEMNQVRDTLRSSLYTQLSISCKKLVTKRTTLKCVLFSV